MRYSIIHFFLLIFLFLFNSLLVIDALTWREIRNIKLQNQKLQGTTTVRSRRPMVLKNSQMDQRPRPEVFAMAASGIGGSSKSKRLLEKAERDFDEKFKDPFGLF
ncbi:hypothetical protein SNEBB_001562 [Seison nebaliae]|nr:hypothetical protein SNEBB_001562 [Seison nebaliae]